MTDPTPLSPEQINLFRDYMSAALLSLRSIQQGGEGTLSLLSVTHAPTSLPFGVVINFTPDFPTRSLLLQPLALIPPPSFFSSLVDAASRPIPTSIPLPSDIPDPSPSSPASAAGKPVNRIILPGDPGFPLT